MANEVVEEARRKLVKGVIFKLDFEKAYDRVSSDFLDLVLKNKGFGDTAKCFLPSHFDRL